MRHQSGRVRATHLCSALRRFTVLLILLFAAGTAFVAPAFAAGTIAGVVHTELAHPIDNAQVDVWRSPDGSSPYVWSGLGHTDGSGLYSVPTSGAGWYKVQFSDPLGRFVTEWWANRPGDIEDAQAIWLAEDESATYVNAVLQDAGRIGGVVTDTLGAPLENIRVAWFRWSDAQQQWVGSGVQWTDGVGHWEAGGLAPGQYKAHFSDTPGNVYGEQYWDHQRSFHSAHVFGVYSGWNVDWLDADLEVGGLITGVVRDGGSNPIGGITVTAFVNDPPAGGWPGIRETTTTPLGFYSLGPLAPGDYRLYFHGDSAWVAEWWEDTANEWDAAAVPLESASNPTCDAVLSRAGSIAGHVVADGTGDPVPGIEVSVERWVGWDFGGWEDRGPLVTTDANGDYLIVGLVPGTYMVGFRDPGGSWASEWHDDTLFWDRPTDVPVEGGATTSVDASLGPAGHIAGVVRDTGGNPIPWVNVNACRLMGETAEEQWIWNWGGQADENGFFTLDGLAPGRYQIELYDPSGVYAVQVYEDALNSGEGIDLFVTAGGTAWADPVLERGGTIYGQVVDADGNGLNGIMLEFHARVGTPEEPGWEHYTECWTDENGDFRMPGLQARATAIHLRDESGRHVEEWYDDARTDAEARAVDVRGGATQNIGRVVLAEAGRIAGRVTAEGGGPLENIEVTIARWRDDWGDWEHFTGGQTDVGGAYDIGGLAAGSYCVRFKDPNQAYAEEWFENAPDTWAAQDVVVRQGGTTTVDAALEQACVIEGHVRDGSGNPLPGIEAILFYRDPVNGGWPQYWLNDDQRIISDADGYFRIAGLPARTYQLRLEDNDNPGRWGAEVFDDALVVGTGTDLTLTPGETRTVDPVLDPGGGLAGRLLDDEDFTPLSFAYPMDVGVWAWVPDAPPEGGSWQWYAQYATGDTTDGYMHGPDLAPGVYLVDFSCWTGDYVFEWWQDQAEDENATPVEIKVGETTDLGNVLLQRSAMISGYVTGPDGQPLANVPVRAWELSEWGWRSLYEFRTWGDGYYQLGNLAGGDYRIEVDGRSGGMAREYWPDAASLPGADVVTLAPRERVAGHDVQLGWAGTLDGTAHEAGGDPAVGVDVRLSVWDDGLGRYVGLDDGEPNVQTDEDGHWRIASVTPGTYRVSAGPSATCGIGKVEGVEVRAKQTTTVDITMPLGASISGTITDHLGLPVQTGVEAHAWSEDGGEWRGVIGAESDANGDYTLGPLAPGTYRVYFGAPSESFPYNIEYWDNRFPAGAGDDITVSEGEVVTGIDCAFGVGGDETPPSAPVVTGADSQWHAAPVELTFAAVDGGSGVEEYEYRVDGGGWRDGGGAAGDRALIGAPATHGNDGAHIIQVRAVDYAANIGPATTVEVRIDTTGPVVSDDDPGLWRRGPVTVNLSAVDAGCGVVDHIEYAPSAGGPWQAGTSFTLATWKRGGGSGERLTWVRAVDGLGNASDPDLVIVYLDARAPVTTHDSDGLVHATDVTVHLTLKDAHSGPGWTYFSVDGGMWMIGNTITVPALKGGQNDGVHWLRFYSVDAVGNVEQSIRSCTVTIDVP